MKQATACNGVSYFGAPCNEQDR